MNDRITPPPEVQTGELARMVVIARVAVAKGWGHYAERLGFGSPGTACEGGAQRRGALARGAGGTGAHLRQVRPDTLDAR